jgi:hypothetical protein
MKYNSFFLKKNDFSLRQFEHVQALCKFKLLFLIA